MQIARLLEVAFIINLEFFPAFRVAFEPALIEWDLDPGPFSQRASEIAKGDPPLARTSLTVRAGGGMVYVGTARPQLKSPL